MRTVVAVVTYNNPEVTRACFDTWIQKDAALAVWDNGSDRPTRRFLEQRQERINHLVFSDKNRGLCVARNRLIEWARDHGAEFVLLADSDVLLYPGCLEAMIEAMADPCTGMVVYKKALRGVSIMDDGCVEEATNECMLTRMAMWLEIGLFPEALFYYSGDSWKSTLANMHGWRTRVVKGHAGYLHYQGAPRFTGGGGSSTTNPSVWKHKLYDTATWHEAEVRMILYWKNRLAHGPATPAMWQGFAQDVAAHNERLKHDIQRYDFWDATQRDECFGRCLPWKRFL